MRIETGVARGLVAIAGAFLLAGCEAESTDPYQGPVTDEAYIEVMTDLMLLDARPLKGGSPAEREARTDSARLAIVSRHGLTGDDVLEFARVRGAEASHMEVLWQEITQRFDSLRVANLSRSSEARSEAEGKLGGDASGAVSSTAVPGGPAADSTQASPPVGRRGREALKRLSGRPVSAPAAADSTPGPR